MSETPQPLWELVRYFNESTVGIGNYGQMRPLSEVERDVARACATELAAALRAWDEQVRAGIEKRKATVHPFGPLYGASTEHAAQAILDNILGVPPKEPAGGK